MSGKLTVTGAISSTGALTVGVDDTGHDVKFFGAAAGAYMLYDQSCDQLEIRGASADATTSTGKLLLSTSLTNVNANDVIGSINFQAPTEAGGTDAIAIAAGIRAVAQATFTCAVNNTDLIFYTGKSEAATEKFRFTADGELGIGGANYGTDGQVLTSAGACQPPAWEDAAGGARCVSGTTDNAIISFVNSGSTFAAEANLTFDGTTLNVAHANGIHITPGSDADANLLMVKVSGCPAFTWDESESSFAFNDTVQIGTAGNANMELGLSMHQGGLDSEIFSLKSSDVAHGITCLTETTTFFAVKKGHPAQGGATFLIGSDGTVGWRSQIIITGCANTSKDSGGVGIIDLRTGRAAASGGGYQAVNSNGNLMSLTCYDGTNNYNRFLWDAEGSAHAEVEWTTFDDYCDIELLRGVHGAMTPCYAPTYKETFGRDMLYNLEKYEELGFVGKNSMNWQTREDGRVQLRGMVNTTSMMMLHHSTIIQMADRFNARLDGIETQLKALSEGK